MPPRVFRISVDLDFEDDSLLIRLTIFREGDDLPFHWVYMVRLR